MCFSPLWGREHENITFISTLKYAVGFFLCSVVSNDLTIYSPCRTDPERYWKLIFFPQEIIAIKLPLSITHTWSPRISSKMPWPFHCCAACSSSVQTPTICQPQYNMWDRGMLDDKSTQRVVDTLWKSQIYDGESVISDLNLFPAYSWQKTLMTITLLRKKVAFSFLFLLFWDSCFLWYQTRNTFFPGVKFPEFFSP